MIIDIKYWESRTIAPGKFEGQGPEAPYFYEIAMEGGSEPIWTEDKDEAIMADLFQTDAHERRIFGLDDFVLQWEDSQGFVHIKDFPTREAAEDFWREYNQ